MATTKLLIKGMHCTSCKKLIEEVCQDMSGVSSCAVDYEAGTGTVEHDGTLDTAGLVNEIRSLGEYKVEIV